MADYRCYNRRSMAKRMAAARSALVGGDDAENAAASSRAGLGARLIAYLIDSIFLFGFTAVFATIAGLTVFVSSDFGEENPSDGAFLALVIILLASMPSWILLNLLLLRFRSQTLGQYVLGLGVTREDGEPPTVRQLGLYFAALHPLGFHPIFAMLWALIAWESVVLASSTVLFIGSIALALLCIAGPVASLLFAAVDGRHRGIHDRLAGLVLIRLAHD